MSETTEFSSLLNNKDNLSMYLNEFKKELLLNKNDFYKQDVYEGLYALAQTIQNLCIVEKGTYPNSPNMGVGIKNYQFEFLDTVTINKLKDDIKMNIDNYINTNFFINFDVAVIEDISKQKVLVLLFSVSDNTKQAVVKPETFSLLFGYNKDSNALISRIIF